MAVESIPDLLIPPDGELTVEKYLQLRGLPRRTQLIDGSLVFASPQEKWHGRVTSQFHRQLDRQAPAHLRADRQMAVRLSDRQMPEPDALVVTAEAYAREEPADYYFAEDLLLAVEVVAPDSQELDREIKPVRYAQARIPSYWRVEHHDIEAVVYTYELDPATNRYGLVRVFRDLLEVAVPYHIDIDLTDIGARF
jgi:Uma2 family endonuclease